jgi:hypothetical protein
VVSLSNHERNTFARGSFDSPFQTLVDHFGEQTVMVPEVGTANVTLVGETLTATVDGS